MLSKHSNYEIYLNRGEGGEKTAYIAVVISKIETDVVICDEGLCAKSQVGHVYILNIFIRRK